MKDKVYSIAQIQKIIDISPNELKKLIRKNSSKIKISTRDLPDGSKETFLDEESFKKLVFIKQLENGLTLSVDEVCEMIHEKDLLHENDELIEEMVSPYDCFDRSLEAVEKEVTLLRSQLTRMVIKYDHCLKELNLSRSRNISFENEMSKLRNREAALMGQMRKDSSAFDYEEICETDLN